MVNDERIVSTREVRREIEDQDDALRTWTRGNSAVFSTPTRDEALFVAEIYKVPHFQANLEQRKLLKGGKNADPFVVARCGVLGDDASVVTLERKKQNAAKVPNICDHFGLRCVDVEQFMEAEGWTF